MNINYYAVGIDSMDNLVMEVTDYLAINKAKIEINKINVVGGVNSSGKSTLSKIFYSLLKGNSVKRRDYALQSLVDDINETIDKLNYECNEYTLPRHLTINDNYSYIKRILGEVLEICKIHKKNSEKKLIELVEEIDEILKKLTKKLEDDGFDVNELKLIYDSPKADYGTVSLHSEDLNNAIKNYVKLMESFYPISLFCNQMANYENILNYSDYSYGFDFLLTEDMQDYFKNLNKIKKLQSKFLELFSPAIISSHFPILDFTFQKKWDRFFGEDNSDLSRDCLSEIFDKEHIFDKGYPIGSVYGIHFELYLKIIDSKIDAFDYFFQNGLINSVYYVDNLSIMDLLEIQEDDDIHLFHNKEIFEDLYKKIEMEINFKSDIIQESNMRPSLKYEMELNQDIEDILKQIENIISGSYKNYGNLFSSNKILNDEFSNLDLPIVSYNTASGIKQIGIIQLLLYNNQLKKDGFLIIDEPEVNLHPDWQFKFAEILVLLAKDLNITIYVNSHSPFFIEAIDAFTEFYDMQDDINYYLSEESEVENKYDFIKIESDELYRIYDNLGNAYDLIDQLRLKKHLGE